MVRYLMATAFLLSLLCSSHAQTWTTVTPPADVTLFKLRSDTNISWKYPFDRGCPAGEYEVSNAIVDRSQQVGTWSKPTRFTTKAGWSLYAAPWNQPTTRDDVGIVWKVKCISVDQPGGAFQVGAEISHSSNLQPLFTVAPYSGDGPYLQRLFNNWNDYRPLTSLKTGGRNTIEAPPPPAYPSSFPNVEVEVGVCGVTETGETAMSPTVIFPAEGLGNVRVLSLGMMNAQWAQGTIGYHVYYRRGIDEVWQRVPAPHCHATPSSPDDWLFQWYDSQPVLSRIVANAPSHQPVVNPQSRLNAVQLAMKNETGDFEVPRSVLGVVTYDCFCPVLDEYGPGSNKQGRWIGTENVRPWKLVQQTSQSGHTYWPVLVIANQYSTWRNVKVVGQRGASAAITWHSMLSGGQGFGTTLDNCSFGVNANQAGVTFGVYVSDRCSRWPGDHTASELLFEDCDIFGEVCIGLEGNQTANVQFARTYANAFGTRRGCVCWSGIPSQFDFTGALYADCYSGSVFRTPWMLKVSVEKIWIDQGFDHLVDAGPVNSVTMKFTGGKLNAWGLLPNLARIIEAQTPTTLVFDTVDVQMNTQPFAILANSGQYNFFDLRFNLTNLADLVVVRDPTEVQTATEWPRFMRTDSAYPAGRPTLGYHLAFPAETISTLPITFTVPGDSVIVQGETFAIKKKINGAKTDTVLSFSVAPKTVTTPPKEITLPAGSITIPARSLTFNSMSGRQQVRRQDWWADPVLIANP
jgi:hypothetical protein